MPDQTPKPILPGWNHVPDVLISHVQHQALTPATSQTGLEALLFKDRKILALGTFHHQMRGNIK